MLLRDDLEAQKRPYEDEICLCNTLIHYLNRFVANTDVETVSPTGFASTPVSSPATEEPAPLNNQGLLFAFDLFSVIFTFHGCLPVIC